RALAGLRKAEDPIVDDPAEFATFSVAGRGLLALERLLFDTPEFGAYDCRIVRAIARDIGRNADLIASEWTSEWAPLIRTAGSADNDVFRAGDEATRTLFTALQGALQEIADLRLARPLGTIDRPRPKRAEAWRSGRALPNIAAVLGEAEAFYQASFRPQISEQAQEELDIAFASVASAMERALEVAPISEAVTSTDRIRIDGLMAAIVGLNDLVTEVLGPELGVTRGFNSRDGD
ncbi:MAG: imelysin family protein, partial [Pseudomonadota bacterium]